MTFLLGCIKFDFIYRRTTLVSKMENALSLGQPVLLYNVHGHQLNPILRPLLSVFSEHEDGGNCLVKFGNRRIQVHENFRLYLATAEVQHNLSEDMASHLTVVNYSPSFELVQECLLNRVDMQVGVLVLTNSVYDIIVYLYSFVQLIC